MEHDEALELVTEQALEAASEGEPYGALSWHRSAAFTSLVLGLMAATSALFAGITAHEVLIERTEQVIDINLLEAERLSIEILEAKHDVLEAVGVEPSPEDQQTIDAYAALADAYESRAAEAQGSVTATSSEHLRFAIAATVIALGIALSGLAVMMSSRWVWIGGTLVGVGGGIVLISGFVNYLSG